MKQRPTDLAVSQTINPVLSKADLATLREADLLIKCPARGCGAKKGANCKGLAKGVSHFARRLKWVLATKGLLDE
jgi:hypothetical protein